MLFNYVALENKDFNVFILSIIYVLMNIQQIVRHLTEKG
jgi:hypothetical protein